MSWPRFRSSALARIELEYLAREVEDIHLIPGEYVAHEGEGRFLAIVVEGKTELTKVVNGAEQVIGRSAPRGARRRDPDDARLAVARQHAGRRPSRVLKVTVKVFHTLAAMAPQVSETVGAAALERLEMLRNATAQPFEPRDVRDRPAPSTRPSTPPKASSIATRFPRSPATPTIPPLLHAAEVEPPWPPPIPWWSYATALG